jgi:hypothetical protein
VGRLEEFGRDLAGYFAIGESPAGETEQTGSWRDVLVALVPALVAGLALRSALDADETFGGFLATLGLIGVLALVWGSVLRLVRRSQR